MENKDKQKTERSTARILVVEDHAVVREGFVALINRESDLEVCCEANNPAEALAALAEGAPMPDLMVVDLFLQGGDGINLIKDVHALHAGLPILVISMQDEDLYAERALRAGARGYIMKENATEVFLDAIRSVLAGEFYLSRKMQARLLHKLVEGKSSPSESSVSALTDRELHVFQLIGAGLPTREIAVKLGISVKTVESHRENIKNKLNINTGAGLAREATSWVNEQR